jgi:hypothetical protein
MQQLTPVYTGGGQEAKKIDLIKPKGNGNIIADQSFLQQEVERR